MYLLITKKVNYSNKRFKILLLGTIFLFSKTIYAFMDYPYGVGFQIINPPLLPLDNLNPGKGKISVRLNARLINVWSIQTNRFITDGEEGQIEPNVRYALTDSSSIGFNAPMVARGGGFLDKTIETFHRSTGVTQGQRDQYTRNQFNVSYEPLAPYYPLLDKDLLNTYIARTYDLRQYPRVSSDPPVSFPTQEDEVRRIIVNKYYPYLNEYKTEDSIGNYDSVAGGNPKLFFQSTFFKGYYLFDKITGGMQIKVPVRTVELIGTPGTDISIFAVYHKDWFNGIINYKFGISYSQFQIRKYRNLDLRGNQWVFRPSLVYNINENLKFHFEYVYYASPILHWSRLSVPTNQVGFGLTYKLSDYALQLGVFENILTYSNTPDIGFLVSLEKYNLN